MIHRRKWILRTLLGAAACGLWWKAWKAAGDDPILSLMLYVMTGAALGFWVIGTLLPWAAEAIGASIFLPGKKTSSRQDEEPPAEEEETLEDDEK